MAGLALALAATRALRGLLYGISPTDQLAFVLAPLVLLTLTLLACLEPAVRAASLDPAAA